MNIDEIISINTNELIKNGLGSFNDLYSTLSTIQKSLHLSDIICPREKAQLSFRYKTLRENAARRVENSRQMVYKQAKYDAWYQEIKNFYERLPATLEF